MSEIKRVKIDSIIESQIPQFLSEDSPLFVEFLKQYYKSLEHQSGTIDLALNIKKYKDVTKFTPSDLTTETVLVGDVLTYDDTIIVESTVGWPDTYGLLKIDNEIITYTSKTSTSFLGCIRGFSGIDAIESLENSEFLNFSQTSAEEHSSESVVQNLSNLFLLKFYENFKYEFFLGFENRDFDENISIENVLLNARNFYISKGTDSSYKFLFKVLYGSDIDVIKPNDFTLKPSSDTFFVTKNVLVEKISGDDPVNTKGNFLFQNIGLSTATGSIFNVEFRPVSGKNLYEISLDASSISGTFEASGQTKILEDVPVGSNNILVDSTIGFAQAGKILVKPENSDFIEISYSDKTSNQFLGVTGITKELPYGLSLVENKFAYSYIGFGNTSRVDFRVINVIQDIDFKNTNNLRVGDKIRLSSFGKNLLDDIRFNSWIYNLPTKHDVKLSEQETSNKFRLTLFDKISAYKNEKILVFDENNNFVEAEIIDVDYDAGDLSKKYSNKILTQFLQTGIDINKINYIQRTIYKANHSTNYFPSITKYPAGVQNTYLSKDNKYFYVTASGLPNYTVYVTDDKRTVQTVEQLNRPALLQGFTSSFYCPDHNYVNGNLVYYDTKNFNTSGISTGYYYVTVVDDNNIKLSFSKSDIFSKKYIEAKAGISSDTVVIGGYENKSIEHQKILKKFPFTPEPSVADDFNKRSTNNRQVGLLANGVEVLSATYFDENIFYGFIDSIEVTNPGSGYDVVDAPPIEIIDSLGSGARAHVNLSGKVERIKIISPGIGYQSKPKINIFGGNGQGCSLESNLVKSRLSYGFKSEINVDEPSNSISFLTNIAFEDGEEVVYDSNTNLDVPGLVNGSTYFVGIVSETRIKIYNNKEDSLNKVNEVDIVGVSSGFHYFSTLKTKNTITEIYVKDPGQGYSNRKIKVPSILSSDNNTIGINTFDSYIFAPNHGFSDVELVQYSTTGTAISGLSTTSYYYVKVIDNNKFKLSFAGVGISSLSTQTYVDNKYIKFESLGVGTHVIGYPPITITVESTSALASTSIISPVLKPVVLGQVDDVYIEYGGVSYGCTDIINFHRRPDVGISSVKSEASLNAIVVNGKIVDVKITNGGLGYRQDSDIIIIGDGDFAKIEPIIDSNGKLSQVNIIDGGVGYGLSNTTLKLENRGKNVKFLANLKQWKVNQVVKLENYINPNDDSILLDSKNNNLGLQVCSYYIPKKLRYQLSDNFTSLNKETSGTLNHSPILGYAYDGNPIYGPYGYDKSSGGSVRKINTSYTLSPVNDPTIRPPSFSAGYFINDYVYDSSGDLDEHNGRFCVTPEYPNGVYAYFYSIDVDASKVAKNVYPYIVGPTFNNLPVEENFLPVYNQDHNFFTNDITRNIGPYYVNYARSSYDLIDSVSENYKQEFEITDITTGKIEDVSIFSPGDNYKVNDLVILDNQGSGGTGANIVVSKLKGKEISDISVQSRSFSNVVFIPKLNLVEAQFDTPHEFSNLEPIVISGLSTISALSLEGLYNIKVDEKSIQLIEDIPLQAVTGVSTFIKVKDISGFSSNDLIGIGTEKLLITRISPERSGFYVNRISNTGFHTAGIDDVVLLPKKFTFTTKNTISGVFIPNTVTFFDPKETVGTGSSGVTRTVVGLGTTSFQSRFIPPKSIYLPNHKFYTGQPLTYNAGFAGTSLYANIVGSAVSFPIYNNQTVYAVNLGRDYIGLSTVGYTTSLGIGTDLTCVEFWRLDEAFGVVGSAHSLTTQNQNLTGSVKRTSGIVTTSQSHGLSIGDQIEFKITSTLNENYKIFFDKINRKILIGEYSFNDSNVSLSNNSVENSSFENIKNGTKIVYFADNPLGGLSNGKTYFILKKDINKICFCEYESDVYQSKEIDLTSLSAGGSQSIKIINPQITPYNGSIITFDVSDSSLTDLSLDFYVDNNFSRRVEIIGLFDEGFAITRSGILGQANSYVSLDTNKSNFPKVLYYKLNPISPLDQTKNQISVDTEVPSHNKINVIDHQLNTKIKIDLINEENVFSFNSTKKLSPSELQILPTANITYTTTSETADGPIEDIKINFGGRGYSKNPVISRILSESGNNAVLKLISNDIGKIESLKRIKDGFDYPTDPTLSAQLSSTIVCGIKDIRTIDYIKIINVGKNYNTNPVLFIKNNENQNIELKANINGGSVTSVDIIKNSTSLSSPLEIVPIYNSNGYEIDAFNVAGNDVTIELFNSPTSYPLINSGYGSTLTTFPFSIGDEIFIEKCLLTSATNSSANFNSSSYNYTFFTVTGISTINNTITYSMAGISTGSFGTYNDERRGVVVNKKDMVSFEMILKDDVKYQSSEKVISPDFSGKIMENGWDDKLNQMRITNATGNLQVGDSLFGESSKITGVVEYLNSFELNSTLGATRDKTTSSNTDGLLNDFQQRISDNFYYQKFSYSLRTNVPYSIWRESVRSIVHPSGFQEFSDYTLYTQPTSAEVVIGIAKSENMKPKLLGQDSSLFFNIDSELDFSSRKNYALVYEDDPLPDGSTDKIFFTDGVELRPYILNQTNKVIRIDDISPEFTGTTVSYLRGRYSDAADLLELNKEFIQEEVVAFVEFNYPNITSSITYDAIKCKRDVGYIVDAIAHDLKYDSNNQSVEAGLAYWNAGSSYISSEIEETLFAYNYVKFIGQYIINNQTPPTLYQSSVEQQFNFDIIQDELNYPAGRYKDARNLILLNKREIQDRSLAAVAVAHSDFYFPGDSITNSRSRYYDGYRLIQQNRTEIIDTAWNNTLITFPGISSTQTKCKRDLGYFVDAVSTDVFTGGNRYSRKFVLQYFLNGLPILNGLAGEELESNYAFYQAGTLMRQAVRNGLTIQDLTITAGPPVYGIGVTVGITSTTACTDVQNTISSLVGLVTSVVSAGNTSILPVENPGSYTTGGLKCFRDLGYIIDGVAQDISYGTNQHTVYNTKKYFNGVGIAITDGLVGEETQSILVFETSKYFMKQAITNQLYGRDLTITADPLTGFNTSSNSCSDVQTNIDTLVGILTVAIGNSSLAGIPTENYGTTDCSDVRTAIGNFVGIITTIIGFGTGFAPSITYPSLTLGGAVVGLSTFKLKNKGTSLFKHIFNSADSNVVSISQNIFNIANHNYQTGQELSYDFVGGNPIGIATTSYVGSGSTILMQVNNLKGTAILENGYSVAISTSISGISTVLSPVGPVSKTYTQAIGLTTTGIGTNAKFNVFITYSASTGQPLSTSIILTEGGNGYSVGETVSIAGTYIGGVTPTNDLTFNISTVGPTGIQTRANETYSNVPSNDGSGATFNVTRNGSGYVSIVNVVNGGVGYSSTSVISIAGTYLGGSANDYVSFSPLVLGSNKLPETVFVYKLNDNQFGLLGLSTSPTFLDITQLGVGSHGLSLKNPNASAFISIDNIVQPPLSRSPLSISLGSTVSTSTTTILNVSSGISSVIVGDVIKLDNEYLEIKNIIKTDNNLIVERGSFGSISGIHTVGTSGTIFKGKFNIVGDTIFFSTPPYGLNGPAGIQTRSSFAGRAFSRQFDASEPRDKNIIFDDISNSFTGVAATQFTLKVDGNTTTTVFNNVNNSTDINNIPFIFINGVFQSPVTDVTVDNALTNSLTFLSGTPSAGKISAVSISTSYGYQPRLVASADAVVSVSGTISSITVNGGGSGYRNAPPVSLASTIGYGASLVALVGTSGTTLGIITSIQVVSPGIGYTITSPPTVVIGIPTGYSNLGLAYTGGTSGVGQKAKVTVEVGSGSSIISYKFDDPGIGYKVGDKLKVVGIPTISGSTLNEFVLTVDSVETDSFSGFYPGQFIVFNDISSSFNGFRKKFTLSIEINGQNQIINLKTPTGTDLDITNNIFIFINDILQDPNYSYTFQGSRVIFTEAPLPNSKCVILYYRGSSRDITEIVPPKTIKEGDTVTIQESANDLYDIEQFERVVKTLTSSDQLETFVYSSIGINTDTTKFRPLTWKKQKQDRIISGTLFSKSRPSLQSNITPTATLIKKILPSDEVIYVDNAFPLFSSLDELNENLRDIIITEDKVVSSALGQATVSGASTVSSVIVTNSGVGYANTSSPKVRISSSVIKVKDPIYNWQYVDITGITTLSVFNEFSYGNQFVAVGNSSLYAYSFDGQNWITGNVGVGSTVNLKSVKKVSIGSSDIILTVGSKSKIVQSVGYSSTLTSWSEIPCFEEVTLPGVGVVGLYPTTFNGTLNSISPGTNNWVAVGAGGSIFVSSGIITSKFVSRYSGVIQDLNSVAFGNNYYVAVGNNGTVISSDTGFSWDTNLNGVVLQTYRKVIFDGSRFIVVGNSATILKSINRNLYQQIPNNIDSSENIINITYFNGLYVAITSANKMYYSFDLSNWTYRDTLQPNQLTDLLFVDDLGFDGTFISVGYAGTIITSTPVYHRATAESVVTDGQVSSINITDGGFGYFDSDVPSVIIEPDTFKTELIKSFKVKGDYGDLIGITTFLPGTPGIGTTSPKLEFRLKSETYDNSTLGVGYSAPNTFGITASQLEKGDYFVISQSNVQTDGSLIGISTFLGGMSNYPNSKIGIATNFLDGVYIVEDVTTPFAGIVTVTCHFAPDSGTSISVSDRGTYNAGTLTFSGINTNGFYGRYSWSKFYDFQNRSLSLTGSKSFDVYTDNGLTGLSTCPKIIRTRPSLSN